MVYLDKPFPSDWQKQAGYVWFRIWGLERALPFCRGRAADVRPLVEAEIVRLKKVLYELDTGKTSDRS